MKSFVLTGALALEKQQYSVNYLRRSPSEETFL